MDRLPETFLYHIWDAQHLQKKLTTISGKSLSILYQGNWNTDKGADFNQAFIEIDGVFLQGDVEIHFNTFDWKSHNHHHNKHFNDVVLHVVFQHSGKSITTQKENREEVEILELKPFLTPELEKLIDFYHDKPFQKKEHLCNFFSGLNKDQTIAVLQYFGKKRVNQKVQRFAAELKFNSFDQILYQGLFESLGYAKNKLQMLQLAKMVRYKDVQDWYQKGLDIQTLLAIYLFSNSLVNHIPLTVPVQWQQKWKNLYANQTFFSEEIHIKWNLFRIRPKNHPVVRILQIITVLEQSLKTSLQSECVSLFSFPKDHFSLSVFKDRFYNWICKSNIWFPESFQLGKKRADTILINIIIPLMINYAQQNNFLELEKVIYNIYQSYSALSKNHILRHMETGLEKFQLKLVSSSAQYQQGLHYLYNTYCKYHMCDICKIRKDNIIRQM